MSDLELALVCVLGLLLACGAVLAQAWWNSRRELGKLNRFIDHQSSLLGEALGEARRLKKDATVRDARIDALEARIPTEREKLSEEDRKALAARHPIEPYPGAAMFAPQDVIWVGVFDSRACPVCDGIHISSVCPAARKVTYHETPITRPDGSMRPNLASATYRDSWDDSGIIWRSDVFGVAPEEPSTQQEAVGAAGN